MEKYQWIKYLPRSWEQNNRPVQYLNLNNGQFPVSRVEMFDYVPVRNPNSVRNQPQTTPLDNTPSLPTSQTNSSTFLVCTQTHTHIHTMQTSSSVF